MPKYLIASNYFERETDLAGSTREAENPFEAIIQDCMIRCSIQEWEACQMFEVESWDIVIWELKDGEEPQIIGWREVQYPLNVRSELNARVKQLREAIETAEKLEVLATVPGSNAGSLDLAPVREEMNRLEQESTAIQAVWDRRREKPVEENREKRSVQVDAPEEVTA